MLRRSLLAAIPAASLATLPNLTAPAHAQPAAPKPLVKIVATGGTIANSPQGRMSVDSVMTGIPQLAEIARIEVEDVARIGSSAITVQNWIDIAAAIDRSFRTQPELAGIVVTHGSNTAEETAYFLSLVVKHDKPVVVTGAQRQNNTLGEEGKRNLFDAVKVAATPEAGGKGVLLVVNEMIHAARDVTKTLSVRIETWDSRDLGALGLVDSDKVRLYRAPSYRHTTSSLLGLDGITRSNQLPRVDILYSYADADGALVKAMADAGAKGIVVAGFPTGSPTPAQRRALEEVSKGGIAVVMSHRGGQGRISTGNAFISADNLTPQKARVLLMLALAKDPNPTFVRQVFDTH